MTFLLKILQLHRTVFMWIYIAMSKLVSA